MEGCTPGWFTVCTRAARGMRGAPLGPCPPPGPAPFLRALGQSPLPVRRGSPGCARPLPLGPYGRPGRRPPGCSGCRARSHPEFSPAPPRSAGRRVRPRAPPRAALRHQGRVGVVAWGTSLLRCSGPFPRGAEGGHTACRWRRFRGCAARGGLPDYLQVGVRACVLLWEVSFAASESQRPDDLVCRVQRWRSGACFAWGRGGSATVVSLCLRAGGRVRISHGWCTCCGRGGAWVGELEPWLRVRALTR